LWADSDDEFDSIVREWRMTKKRIEMINSQLKQPLNPKSAQLKLDLEPVRSSLCASDIAQMLILESMFDS